MAATFNHGCTRPLNTGQSTLVHSTKFKLAKRTLLIAVLLLRLTTLWEVRKQTPPLLCRPKEWKKVPNALPPLPILPVTSALKGERAKRGLLMKRIGALGRPSWTAAQNPLVCLSTRLMAVPGIKLRINTEVLILVTILVTLRLSKVPLSNFKPTYL